jgi:arsenite methyltransferase
MPDHSMHPGGLRLTDRAVRLAGLAESMTVADIGCGAGATAAYLADKYKFKMVGLEISEPLIRAGLRHSPGLHLIRWDCKTLPFEPESLDAVLLECSLSVIGCGGSLLADCAQALKPGSALILSDLLRKDGRADDPSAAPSPAELESRLADAGFSVAVSEDHTPALVTYACELRERFGHVSDLGRLFGARAKGGFKLSDYCYHLIVARKQ